MSRLTPDEETKVVKLITQLLDQLGWGMIQPENSAVKGAIIGTKEFLTAWKEATAAKDNEVLQ